MRTKVELRLEKLLKKVTTLKSLEDIDQEITRLEKKNNINLTEYRNRTNKIRDSIYVYLSIGVQYRNTGDNP